MSERKDHNCDICGVSEAFEVPHAHLYTGGQPIHICAGCGFVYVRSRRSAEEIASDWSEEVFGNGYTARIPAVKARQMYVADFIDVNLGLKEKHLVDIGAGEGQFLEIARDLYGADVFGIEPSSHNCKMLSEAGMESFEGTIESFAESESSIRADIVTVMWTLENCQSCRSMLTKAHDILNDGGSIVIATGSRILVPFKKPLHDYLSTRSTDLHNFRFSANALQSLLAECSFEVTHLNRYEDTDYLVVIAKKRPEGTPLELKTDDPIKVYDFFDRWHKETIYYR